MGRELMTKHSYLSLTSGIWLPPATNPARFMEVGQIFVEQGFILRASPSSSSRSKKLPSPTRINSSSRPLHHFRIVFIQYYCTHIATMSDSEELVELPEDEEEEEDLFGDEPADDAQDDRSRAGSERAGSDQDDAEGGARDYDTTAAADYRTKVIEAVEVQRHRVPKAKDQRVSGRDGSPGRDIC